jgi:endonuclease III
LNHVQNLSRSRGTASRRSEHSFDRSKLRAHTPKSFVPSGTLWCRTPRLRNAVIRRVCNRLHKHYGEPRLGNPSDPLDDLIYIILSNRTSPTAATDTYHRLKVEFEHWSAVAIAPIRTLRRILLPLGLSTTRSQQIRSLLRQINHRFGSCDLNLIRSWPDDAVHEYLISLPGVSDKVAKCVMMYTLGREVLPVDVHVHRIASRLGWVSRRRADQCHPELEAIVPMALRFSFHVDCVAHGRAVCRPKFPRCRECVISDDCEFAKRNSEVSRG